jgi:hypothetical protein
MKVALNTSGRIQISCGRTLLSKSWRRIGEDVGLLLLSSRSATAEMLDMSGT